jgi:hypothetical protein
VSLIPIAELAGIGQPAVMCLNRIGINTLADLLAANPDEVAYHLDSYDEAERVLKAARKRAADDAEAEPETPAAAVAEPTDHPPAAAFQPSEAPLVFPRTIASRPSPTGIGAALSLAAAHAGDCAPGHDGALGLCERLSAVALVLEHGGGAAEAAAAAIHDAVLSPGWAMTAAEARSRFGPEVGDLVEQCARIQGVPLSPMGRPQAAYVELVRQTSPAARRICAAQALATVRLACSLCLREGSAGWERFHGGREFCIWYYRALSSALSASGRSPLADELASSVERLAEAGREPVSKAA